MEDAIMVKSWKQGSDEYVSNGISIIEEMYLSVEINEFISGQNIPNP